MSVSYLLLGSNIGNKIANLNSAVAQLLEARVIIKQISPIYQTKAWGNVNQDDFYNVVVKIETALEATALLNLLLAIELKIGRVRGEEQWLPRIIDMDILYFNDEIIKLPQLVVPHPYLSQRRFTLIPLNDIAPHYKHPQLNLTNKELLQKCTDTSEVWRTNHTLSLVQLD